LLESAARLLEPGSLGLELAMTRGDESYGVAGLLLVTGSSFRQGLARSLGYQRLWGDGERFRLVAAADGCAVHFRHPGPSRLAAAVATECAFVEVLEAVRALVEPDAVPLEVEFTHDALGDTSALADHFGVAPRFARAESRILLDSALVDRPLRAFRDLLGAALERQAARALSLLPARHSVAARVRPLLSDEAGLNRSMVEVARALRLSSRTLQRRLTREGTSFQRLHDEQRESLALDLEREGIAAKEIAYRLGFQDPSALARAKRRWGRKLRRT
jgi:AraC-like DNA-binding protein